MFIRYAKEKDIKRILKIYESARKYMSENGNPSQWRDNYPSEQTVRDDIGTGDFICTSLKSRQK